jgi:hypothetical protein
MPVFRSLLAALVCCSLGLGAELRTLPNNKTVSGQLVSLDAKQVVLNTPAGEVKTPVSLVLDLVLQELKPFPPDTRRIDVELTDGTLLKVKPDGLVIKGTKAELTLLSGQKVKLKLKDVATAFRDAGDAKLLKQWQEILKKKVKSDRVVAYTDEDEDKKDRISSLEGTFGDADAKGEEIEFTRMAVVKKFAIAKIRGLVFYRPEPNKLSTLCQLHDNQGNLFMVHTLKGDKNGLTLTTVTGAKVEYKDLTAVARLDYNINKLNYLSALKPTEISEKSASGWVSHYRLDKNFNNGKIRLGGKTYDKGISVHADAELQYDLKEKYREFTAVLGVDEGVKGDSHAVVTVECDGVRVFSQEISRELKDPVKLTVKVKGVAKMKIIVRSDPSKNSALKILNLGDHVVFANAKVSQ